MEEARVLGCLGAWVLVHTCASQEPEPAVYPQIERVSERDRRAALGDDSEGLGLGGRMTGCHAQNYLHGGGVGHWGRADSVRRGVCSRGRRLSALEVSEKGRMRCKMEMSCEYILSNLLCTYINISQYLISQYLNVTPLR